MFFTRKSFVTIFALINPFNFHPSSCHLHVLLGSIKCYNLSIFFRIKLIFGHRRSTRLGFTRNFVTEMVVNHLCLSLRLRPTRPEIVVLSVVATREGGVIGRWVGGQWAGVTRLLLVLVMLLLLLLWMLVMNVGVHWNHGMETVIIVTRSHALYRLSVGVRDVH